MDLKWPKNLLAFLEMSVAEDTEEENFVSIVAEASCATCACTGQPGSP